MNPAELPGDLPPTIDLARRIREGHDTIDTLALNHGITNRTLINALLDAGYDRAGVYISDKVRPSREARPRGSLKRDTDHPILTGITGGDVKVDTAPVTHQPRLEEQRSVAGYPRPGSTSRTWSVDVPSLPPDRPGVDQRDQENAHWHDDDEQIDLHPDYTPVPELGEGTYEIQTSAVDVNATPPGPASAGTGDEGRPPKPDTDPSRPAEPATTTPPPADPEPVRMSGNGVGGPSYREDIVVLVTALLLKADPATQTQAAALLRHGADTLAGYAALHDLAGTSPPPAEPKPAEPPPAPEPKPDPLVEATRRRSEATSAARARGGRTTRISDETRADICQDYLAGSSVAQIAEIHQVSVPSVYTILTKAGIARRGNQPRQEQQR